MGKKRAQAARQSRKRPSPPQPKGSPRKRVARKKPADRTPRLNDLVRDPQFVFDSLINAFPDFAMIADKGGRLLACNRRVLQRLPRPYGVRRSSVFDVFPHISRAVWEKAFFEYRNEHRAIRFERNSGSQYFSHHLYPVADESGEVSFVVVFVQDITEYRHAENALQESERKYRELVENISDAIYALNEEGDVIYVNPAVEAFLGFTQEEVRGKAFRDLLHPAEAAQVAGDFEGFLAGRTQQREFRFLHKDGSPRWGRVASHPVVFKDEVIGYQGVISDITQIKTFNVNLLRIVQENILSSLAAAFTAEIGTPLKRARERLLSHSAPAGPETEVNASLRALMHDLEGISLYLKHFTAFTGPNGEAARALDVNTLVESALALLAQQFAGFGIETECALARGLEPVSADSFSLVQAFMNVFNYSLHACVDEGETAAPKRIFVGTSMEQDKVIVEVRDTSRGVSDELIAHLADPFFAHRKRKDAGIGLAIARQLVESQGGFFQVITGEETGGTHIRISFPSLIQTI
jgi:PAS domain S-box-containing protein